MAPSIVLSVYYDKICITRLAEHVSGAENGAERAENGMSGSWKKSFEREQSGQNRPLKSAHTKIAWTERYPLSAFYYSINI